MAQYKLKVGKIGQSIIDTHKKIESATVAVSYTHLTLPTKA